MEIKISSESTNAKTSPAKIKKAKVLFEDAEFPASDSSLYYMIQPKQQIKWLRPTVIFTTDPIENSRQSNKALNFRKLLVTLNSLLMVHPDLTRCREILVIAG